MFAPLGARLAARFSDNSVVQGASAAGAGVLGASVFGGLISKAQELAPMAMEYRAGVSRATLGGWGEPLGRSGRSTRRNYGLGLLQLSRELPELAGHFPGAFGGHEGNDFAGGLGQTLGIGFSGVSQLVQPMLSMRGGGRIFSGMGSEGAAGAGEARNELLRRLFTDAQAAGMERALPEFAQAVTEGVASATRGLLYTTEQIRNIQTRVSIHTSELVQQGMTAAQAAKLAAGFQAGPGQLADMFLRGGYTPELEMASTYQAMRGLGVRGNDEFLRSLTSMSTGESSAAPLYAGLLQQAFRPGTSEFGQRAQSAMVGARMGLDPRQAYQQVYTPFRQRFMERGQVTADDVREILRADQPGRDPASDTTTATGRMQELMRGEGAGVRALADFQNRQLHLALKLVHLGTASLNVETAMLALMARGANRAGGDWSVNMMRQATTYMNELAAGRHPTLPRGMGVYGDIVELAAGAFQTATGDLPPPGTAGTGGRSGPDQ